MNLKSKILVAFLSLCAHLAICTSAQAEPIRAEGSAAGRKVVVTIEPSEQNFLIPVSVMALVVDGRTLGQVVAYDDPTTSRPADGFELYSSTGELIAIGWFDQFGIRRLGVDRALVDGGDQLEGIFVWVIEGYAI